MAGFVAFELWIPLLAIVVRALVGPTAPTAVQAVVPLFGIAVPTVVALALSDYLADRRGLVRPYQPKRHVSDADQDEEPDLGEEEPSEDEEVAEEVAEEEELEAGEREAGDSVETETETEAEADGTPNGGNAGEDGWADDRGGNSPGPRPRHRRGR
jgi:hypothetical protein